jgi:signal recognition particle GTPase
VFVTQFAAEKFTKKLLGEGEIETVLERLDRLTQDEARMTVAQTLGVVHGLMGNVKVVMEGAQLLYDRSPTFV